jgi:hypothetical protein
LVERQLPKLDVEGSNPLARFVFPGVSPRRGRADPRLDPRFGAAMDDPRTIGFGTAITTDLGDLDPRTIGELAREIEALRTQLGKIPGEAI